MSYGKSRAERILLGDKISTKSGEKKLQYFIQGTEIRDIGIARSGLPILGKNERYKVIDTELANLVTSDKDYFTDIGGDANCDAGLSQDPILAPVSVLISNEETVLIEETLPFMTDNAGLWGDFITRLYWDNNAQAYVTRDYGFFKDFTYNNWIDHQTGVNPIYTSTLLNTMLSDFLGPGGLGEVSMSSWGGGTLQDVFTWSKNHWFYFLYNSHYQDFHHEPIKLQSPFPWTPSLFPPPFPGQGYDPNHFYQHDQFQFYYLDSREEIIPAEYEIRLLPTTANVKFPEGRYKQSISFELNRSEYGYGKEYIDSTPFFDMEKYDAVSYISANAPTGMFPLVGSFVSYDEKLSYNGIVEPFEIRSRALGLNTFLEHERQPGSVSSDLDQMPVCNYDSRENDLAAEFFEDQHSKGSVFKSAAAQAAWLLTTSDPLNRTDDALARMEVQFISDYNKNTYPYTDRSNWDLLISDPAIRSVQLSMDPTIDEGILPITHVDMSVGFDSFSRDRINSLIYRGMTRR